MACQAPRQESVAGVLKILPNMPQHQNFTEAEMLFYCYDPVYLFHFFSADAQLSTSVSNVRPFIEQIVSGEAFVFDDFTVKSMLSLMYLV